MSFYEVAKELVGFNEREYYCQHEDEKVKKLSTDHRIIYELVKELYVTREDCESEKLQKEKLQDEKGVLRFNCDKSAHQESKILYSCPLCRDEELTRYAHIVSHLRRLLAEIKENEDLIKEPE